jgi:hypothetical protein
MLLLAEEGWEADRPVFFPDLWFLELKWAGAFRRQAEPHRPGIAPTLGLRAGGDVSCLLADHHEEQTRRGANFYRLPTSDF